MIPEDLLRSLGEVTLDLSNEALERARLFDELRVVEVARAECLARLHDAVESLADVLYADGQDDEPDDLFRLTERAI